ncbi:hypothetical protein KSS87_019265 [Heliosperma pusillum]|nr:hypothetical protein KSS87_019265 [Heliosperma pusillum]
MERIQLLWGYIPTFDVDVPHMTLWNIHTGPLGTQFRSSGHFRGDGMRGDGMRAKEAVRDQSRTQWRGKGKTFNCFLCGGPHMVRECPQRAKISAMMMRYEDEESSEAHEPRRLGAMRLLNKGGRGKADGLATATKLDVEPTLKATRSVEPTLKATGVVSKESAGLDATTNCEVELTKKTTEFACKVLATNKEAGRKYKGNLLTVNGKVNGVHTRVLVDSGATHNYVALRVARDMDICYTKTEVGELKAVNSSATPIYGVAHGVPLRLGKWKGTAKFRVVYIDDEDVVLGMEFIDTVRPFVLGDGVITFVSNGNEFEVELIQQKEVESRIASLRVTRMPRRRRQRRGGEVSSSVWNILEVSGVVVSRAFQKGGRYQSPEEVPFFPKDLSPPLVTHRKSSQELPAAASSVTVNKKIWEFYVNQFVPLLAPKGDDGNYALSMSSDLVCLQTLSRRIHFGKYVAEVKFRSDPQGYGAAIRAKDKDTLMKLLTDEKVEAMVKQRVAKKAMVFGQDVSLSGASNSMCFKVDPALVSRLYNEWVIPLTKDVEVEYLLRRLD